ncbi:MAG: ATP-dependent DNA helicase RecG, partial [Lachnospiraceae bacterium]|nr:ATP-dependent DNA helicase RecG [Candidatus Equihabitans merdae]
QKKLKAEFPEMSIGLMHGRMKGSEKDKVMKEFAEGNLQILVSTTVVEVGVDVPNSTVILIENAERYGLAAHQLRGRVGRGSSQSYCIFMTGTDDEAVKERLDILNKSRDGLEIARHDLSLRGPGDLLGLRQSGESLFRIADIFRDEKMLQAAGETAAAIIEDDPALIREEYIDIKNRVNDFMSEDHNHLVL